MKIFLKDIKEKYPEFEIVNYNEDVYFTTFNHDSRVQVQDSLFLPLIGEKFDGHSFVQSGFENGSVASLYQKDHLKDAQGFKKPLIVVDSIEEGLEKIVNMVVEKIEVPIIAVTGSTGKTTTREILATILSLKGRVLNSDRNYNTLWGNAQLLSQYDGHEYVVLEMGMDRAGEIAWQCRAINPDIGILLNVGHVHALQLGGIENVYLAKKELADYLSKERRPLVLNVDDERLKRVAGEYEGRLITVGSGMSDYNISNVSVTESGTSFILKYMEREDEYTLPILGKGYVYNAAAAIATAIELGFTLEECKEQLKEYKGFEGRFQIKKVSDNLTVIDDAYNANPTSMKMSLETFENIWGMRNDIEKVLILGDMKELGEVGSQEHRKVGDIVKKMNVDRVYYIGEYFEDFNYGEELEDPSEVTSLLKGIMGGNTPTLVLLKASNSIGLSGILEKL